MRFAEIFKTELFSKYGQKAGCYINEIYDGTIAGSATNLMDCLRYVVKKAGISLETAVMCATENPAKEIGIYDKVGSISVGKQADFVLIDEELNIKRVYIDGKEIIC